MNPKLCLLNRQCPLSKDTHFLDYVVAHSNTYTTPWGLNRRKSVLYNSTGTAHTPASNMKISLKLTRGGGGCVMTIFNINKGLK